MFVNARGRVYRIPESKKKLKVGAEAEKQKPSSALGNWISDNLFFRLYYLLVCI